MRSLRIAHTIYLLLGSALLAGGIASTYLILRCASISNSYTAIIQGEIAQAEAVRVVQVTFKKQVQAWKDILLRGKDDASLAKYDNEFHTLASQVDTGAQELIDTVADEQARADLSAFYQQHQALDGQYEQALTAYKANRDFAPADAAVKGKDRPPTDSLDHVVARLTNLAVDLPQREAARTRHETTVLVAVLALLWVSLAAWCVGYARSLGLRLGNCVHFVQGIAQGDLTRDSSEQGRSDELGSLVEAMCSMRDQLNDMVQSIQQVAGNLSQSAGDVSHTSQQIAAAATQQRDHAAQVAAALQEMVASVQEVTLHCHQAEAQATQTEALAKDSRESVSTVAGEVQLVSSDARRNAETVEELGNRSNQIGQIIGLIQEIAEQTNLLALNAAIESARAGEHGRGFAVVAGEVRRLAERTTTATREIGGAVQSIQQGTHTTVDQIRASTGKVERSVSTANVAAQLLQTLGTNTQEMRQMIQQIAQAAEEQSQASGMVGRSMNEIAESIGTSSEGARQTAIAAKQLVTLSSQLTQQASRFRTRAHSATASPAGFRR